MGAELGSGAVLKGLVPMTDVVEVTTDAQTELRHLIEADDKGRRHVRIFIQGWG